MKKPFELGIVVGRFQTLHTGHGEMIDTAIAICGQVGIFVGSSQESGTLKNPLTYEDRARILRKRFGDKVSIYPLPDIGVGNNAAWGNYVLQNVTERFGRTPDLLISGKEERRVNWFDSVEGLTIAELYVPKTIDISSTAMREHLIAGDRSAWQTYTDPLLWDEYDFLREKVIAAKDNPHTASI